MIKSRPLTRNVTRIVVREAVTTVLNPHEIPGDAIVTKKGVAILTKDGKFILTK